MGLDASEMVVNGELTKNLGGNMWENKWQHYANIIVDNVMT